MREALARGVSERLEAAVALLWMAEVAKTDFLLGRKDLCPSRLDKRDWHIGERVFSGADDQALLTLSNTETQDEVAKMIPLVLQSHPGRWVSAGRWWFSAI